MSDRHDTFKQKIASCEESSKRINELMYKLGFTYIGINEKIKDISDQEIGEIDGIWKYGDTVFIIDATNQQNNVNPKSSSFIMKWENKQNCKALKQQLSLSPRTKIYMIICNLSHTSDSSDDVVTRHLNRPNVKLLYKDDIEYFEKQETLIKKFCKYDFLSYLGIKRTDQFKKIKAIKTKIGNFEAFVFSLPVKILLEICYVSRRIKSEGYQRILNESRLSSIRQEISSQNSITFPNAIIVAPSNEKSMQYEPLESNNHDSTPQLVDLYLPNEYCSLRIVDGQHRLLGFASIDEQDIDNFELPVVALNGVKKEEEIQTFIRINSTQKRMDANLILTLKADFNYKEDHPFYKDKIAVEIAKKLNDNSPLKNKIYFGTALEDRKKKTVTLTTVVKQLKSTVLNKRYPLFGENINVEDIYLKIKDILIKLVKQNSKTLKIICDNRGIRVLFKLLRVININYVKQKISKDINAFIIDFASIIDDAAISTIHESYGEGGAKNASQKILEILKKKDKSYSSLIWP